mmetsp:Transcript_22255/g.40099  ORF Transcript_22255/g.40099 Transcript_22255/m.40099 type:complete len:212 (+) Transcript_22255:42-677(+)
MAITEAAEESSTSGIDEKKQWPTLNALDDEDTTNKFKYFQACTCPCLAIDENMALLGLPDRNWRIFWSGLFRSISVGAFVVLVTFRDMKWTYNNNFAFWVGREVSIIQALLVLMLVNNGLFVRQLMFVRSQTAKQLELPYEDWSWATFRSCCQCHALNIVQEYRAIRDNPPGAPPEVVGEAISVYGKPAEAAPDAIALEEGEKENQMSAEI